MNDIILSIVVAAAAVLAIYLVMPWAVKKGLPLGMILDKADAALDAAQGVLEAIDQDPTTESLPEALARWAAEAVAQAEQLWKSSQLTKDARKQSAIDYVVSNLEYFWDVEIDERLKKIIDGAVEAAVGFMNQTKPAEITLLGETIEPQQ